MQWYGVAVKSAWLINLLSGETSNFTNEYNGGMEWGASHIFDQPTAQAVLWAYRFKSWVWIIPVDGLYTYCSCRACALCCNCKIQQYIWFLLLLLLLFIVLLLLHIQGLCFVSTCFLVLTGYMFLFCEVLCTFSVFCSLNCTVLWGHRRKNFIFFILHENLNALKSLRTLDSWTVDFDTQ